MFTKKITKVSTAVAMILLVASCAKDKAYEEVFRGFERQDSKSIYDTSATYIYVPQSQAAGINAESFAPFEQGGEKLVKIRFSEYQIEVYEEERDPLLQGRINENLVLKIPGKHIDYRCKEDSEGNCTNKEEENKEIEWNQKKYFKAKLSKIKVLENNALDIFNGDSKCVSPIGNPAVVDSRIEKGVINIFLEKTYSVAKNDDCINKYWTGDYNTINKTFKVQYSYSMVDVKRLSSENYEPIQYAESDHSQFGFFKTTEKSYVRDSLSQKITGYKMGRWNPKKKEIIYYLSDTYYKPENKVLLDATFSAMKSINRGLKEAKTGFQIILENGTGRHPGDLLNNMIVLIDSPLKIPLLGYGPTVQNPLTGEIVQGHVNMYAKVLESMTEWVWIKMVRLSKEELAEINPLTNTLDSAVQVQMGSLITAPATETSPSVANNTNQDQGQGEDQGQSQESNTKLTSKKISNKRVIDGAPTTLHKAERKLPATNTNQRIQANLNKFITSFDKHNSHRGHGTQTAANKVKNNFEDYNKKLDIMAKHNGYSKEFFKIGGTAKAIIPGVMKITGVRNTDGSLKEWTKLTKEQKDQARDLILSYTYRTTFIHEMGHNLGLRHNFQGSYDEKNFYTAEEAKDLKMSKRAAYSSIMDYSHSELNELSAFGKYDIAALRYGYAREVELKDGSFKKVKASINSSVPSNQLKEYAFCTDEDAGSSFSCNRFDEGTTPTEIATYLVNDYNDNYYYRNFRGSRSEFDLLGDLDYTLARLSQFDRMRTFLKNLKDNAELISGIYNQEFTLDGMENFQCPPEWKTNYHNFCKNLENSFEATNIVKNHLLDVINTPDHLCALGKSEAPKIIRKVVTLESLLEDGLTEIAPEGQVSVNVGSIKWEVQNEDIKSCFHPAVIKALAEVKVTVIGETGRFLNSFGTNHSEQRTTLDIGVRGTWIDKLVAMMTLTKRDFRETSLAFMEMDGVTEAITATLKSMITNENLPLSKPFKTASGQLFNIPKSLDINTIIDGPVPGYEVIREYFGLNLPEFGEAAPKTRLIQGLINTIAIHGGSSSVESKEHANAILSSISCSGWYLI